MRLYLSSFGVGNAPDQLIGMLRGGKRVGVILNAKDAGAEAGRAESLAREMDNMAALGLEPEEVDLREYFGNPEDLEQALRRFDLIWVRGGNAFVLRRAFSQSGADTVFKRLLKEDAFAYGGFSAGLCILAPSLRGFELVDDPNVCPNNYDPSLSRGKDCNFCPMRSFLTTAAITQNRQPWKPSCSTSSTIAPSSRF